MGGGRKLQVFISYKSGPSTEVFKQLHSHLVENGHDVVNSQEEMDITKRCAQLGGAHFAVVVMSADYFDSMRCRGEAIMLEHNKIVFLTVFSGSSRESMKKLWVDKAEQMMEEDPHFAAAIRFIARHPPVNVGDDEELKSGLSDTIVEALSTELAFRNHLIDPRQTIDQPSHGSPEMDSPLLIAVKKSSKESVAILLQAKANVHLPDMMGWSALHWAAMNGNNSIAAALIAAKADLNQQCKTGHTALHVAAEYGKPDVAKLLLLGQADVSATTKAGSSPLYMAVESNKEELVSLLVANKANVNQPNVNGATPLFAAAQSNGAALARLLIQSNADVNRATNDSVTPLIVAAYTNSERVIAVLLDAAWCLALTKGMQPPEADRELRDEDGTALDTAEALGHDRVALMLRTYVNC